MGVKGYIIEIFILVTIIIATSFIYSDNELDDKLDKAINDNLVLDYDYNKITTLMPMSDKRGVEKKDNGVIRVTNYNNKKLDYRVIMKVTNDKKIDYSYLKIELNNQVFSLDSKYLYEDDDYLYFDITHSNIDDIDNFGFNMWLDENVDNINDYRFNYNFIVEKI